MQARYVAKGQEYDGPIPVADLAVDSQGNLLEGHITIASFNWWREVFAKAGLQRCAGVEEALYEACGEYNLRGFYDLYVFARPGVSQVPVVNEAIRQRAREVLKPLRSLRQHG